MQISAANPQNPVSITISLNFEHPRPPVPTLFSPDFGQNNAQNTYYYGLRFYNPEVGRWVSRDPIGERGGDNLYSFVNNKSVNLIDAIGLVGTIAVTRFEPFTSDIMLWHVRGWLFTVIWTPPSDGDWDNPCECKPCKKALWLQKATWLLRRPSPLPDTDVPWHEEWTEAEAGNFGNIWDCTAGANNAGMGDLPQFGAVLLSTVNWWGFIAESYVKCVEGDDAGTVYGKVTWGVTWSDDTVSGFGPLIQ